MFAYETTVRGDVTLEKIWGTNSQIAGEIKEGPTKKYKPIQPKGKRQILYERGLHIAGMTAEGGRKKKPLDKPKAWIPGDLVVGAVN